MITKNLDLNNSEKSLVESFVDYVITPKVKKFLRGFGIGNTDLLIPLCEHFEEYLYRMYKKCSMVKTLVHHNQTRLKDIYVSRTLVRENFLEEKKEMFVVDKMPVDLIKKYKKILIADSAGMGKSTILRFMFTDLVDRGIMDIGIPIYLELHRLNKDRTILTEIQEELNFSFEEYDNDLLLKLIQAGGFIFFFDGLDEVSLADEEAVIIDIQEFISKTGTNNYFVLTSRPIQGLAHFGEFWGFNILPFIKENVYELLGNYDLSKNKVLSGKLVELLKSGDYGLIDEYLNNPLLVSLLYTTFDYRKTIPLKKNLYYTKVYDAYFETHDLSKGSGHIIHDKRSKLDIDDFLRVLRFISFRCLMKGVKYDQETILRIIDESKTFFGNLQFQSIDFLDDLLYNVPFFCKDGTEYRWVYKSSMECFAAYFIAIDAKENQDMILKAIYKSDYFDRYFNVLDFYYEIDYMGFAKNIILPLCESYLKYYNENVFKSDAINHDFIEERVGLLFYLDEIQLLLCPPLGRRSINEEEKRIKSMLEEHYGKKPPYWLAFSPYREGDLVCLLEKSNINTHNTRDIMILVSKIMCTRGDSRLFVSHIQIKPSSIDIKYNSPIPIDVHTGEEDEKQYKMINDVLCPFVSVRIDYNACNAEVERIKEYNNTIDDLIGL